MECLEGRNSIHQDYKKVTQLGLYKVLFTMCIGSVLTTIAVAKRTEYYYSRVHLPFLPTANEVIMFTVFCVC